MDQKNKRNYQQTNEQTNDKHFEKVIKDKLTNLSTN